MEGLTNCKSLDVGTSLVGFMVQQGGDCDKSRVKVKSERQLSINYRRLVGHETKSRFYYECQRKVLKCTIWPA